MKRLLSLLPAMLLVLFVACGGDDDNTYNLEPKKTPIPVDTDPRQMNGPVEAQNNIEFPALAESGCVVLVHKATLNDMQKKEGINYSVEWDINKHTQHWTCYKAYRDVISSSTPSYNVSRYEVKNGKNLTADSQYPNDPMLDSKYQFTVDSYRNSGYDHGHICPSADRQRAIEANYQTFFMTNMQPQTKPFNGSDNSTPAEYSPWYQIERKMRTWADNVDTIYVCKGGIVDSNSKYIGSGINKIPVPSYFFVALLSKKGNEYHAIGFWMKHESSYSSKKVLSTCAKSIDDLEKLTGYDFFCNLPKDIQDRVEKSYSASDWDGKLQ